MVVGYIERWGVDMMHDTVDLARMIVYWGALLRVAMLMLATLRTIATRGRFASYRLGWVELATIPEPYLLAAVTLVLGAGTTIGMGGAVGSRSVAHTLAATAGAALVLIALGLTLWSFLSWPTVFVGHGILNDHQLVTTGAYGAVRHPIYAGVFLIWIGLAIAFASAVPLLIFLLYVAPSYLLYMRAEEAMLREAFGDTYRDYLRRVPMLLPRLRPVRQPAQI